MEPKFTVLDIRDPHERQVMDLVSHFDGVEIPRVNLEYRELVTGIYNYDVLERDHWMLCICQLGLKSGRAHQYMRSKGYHGKVLFGGLDGLQSSPHTSELI